MTQASCIKHPARNPTVVLRGDYLRLCDGDHCAAMVLSQHEHWHNVKLDDLAQAEEHNQAARRAGEAPTQDVELWVYMKQARMKSQLMAMFGDKALTTAYKVLLDKGFLQKRTNPKFAWDKTIQYLLATDVVQTAIDALSPTSEGAEEIEPEGCEAESAELHGSRAQKCAFDTAKMRSPERKDAASKTQECATLKTSSETSFSETSPENPPPPQPPPTTAMTKEKEEEDENALLDGEDEAKTKATEEHFARVESMIAQIAKITGTSIDIDDLRPLALECVQRDHKDAWRHTLAALTTKMAADKPTMPSRYAATVLEKALRSTVLPKAAPWVAQKRPAEAQTEPEENTAPAETPGDDPAPWAKTKARHFLSGKGAAAFKTQHGRTSEDADWVAYAHILEAEAALRTEIESYSEGDQNRARAAMLANRKQKTLLPDPEIAIGKMAVEALTALRDRLVKLPRKKKTAPEPTS